MDKIDQVLQGLDLPPKPPILTPRKRALVDAAYEFQVHDYDPLKTFIPRELVQATLPHRNPGDQPAYVRKNGKYALVVQPGWNTRKNKSYGYPYGSIPRLLMFWLTTEALRTGSRKIELGHTMAEFMRELGLDPGRGGKRSDATRLKNQISRFFNARISFEYYDNEGGIVHEKKLHMQVATKAELWWDMKTPDNPSLFESWINLGEDFYEAITASPMPADMNALRLLKNSPLKLDLYAWCISKAYRSYHTHKSQFVPWRSLMQQLGSDYSDVKNFKRKAKEALKSVACVYPQLKLEEIDGGIKIKPSPPPIAPTQPKRKIK